MQIIKQFRKPGMQGKGKPATSMTTCYLSPQEPDSSFATLTALFDEARRDFPGLRERDVLVRTSIKAGSSELNVDKNGVARVGNPTDQAVIEGIEFRTEGTPPRSYRQLPPPGFVQG